jgi:1-acyl-sn-glycerol-3-phosphate acyltransferase
VLYRVVRLLLSVLRHTVYRPVVQGREHVATSGPVILASNHVSFIDSILIPLVAPRRVAFLAKAEYFEGRGLKKRLVGWLFATLGAIPVERGTSSSAWASLDAALGLLRTGGAFGIYPEGTRSRDGRLGRGKTGVAWLALTADCPVVPVAVKGTDRVQPVGAKWPRPHRITVTFGEPLTFPEQRGQAGKGRPRRVVTDRIMLAIAALSGQEKAGWDETGRAA